MPRAAAFRNVVISLHRLDSRAAFDFSHGYFPHHAFTEWVQVGEWTVGRPGGRGATLHLSWEDGPSSARPAAGGT
jgi:hypothetical protein